jgi:tripartite ATP-independent transporter DctM subunit
MDWPILLAVTFGLFLVLMATSLHVAFVFVALTIVGAVVLWGGDEGLRLLILNMRASVSSFSLLPIVAFTLMGAVIFNSGVGGVVLRILGHWLGALPGRLGVLAIVFSTLFATMSGSSIASTTVMGTLLLPEMERQGYKKPISIGSITGGGGLAVIIPPSGLVILLAAVANLSVARLLISGAVPGLMMAGLYFLYIVGRCYLQKDLAPGHEIEAPSLKARLRDTFLYVVPTGLIIFLVLGLIFLGVATPTESAAAGVIGSIILAAINRNLTWKVLRDSLETTVRVAVMIFVILTSSITFSQILAFSGITGGVSEFAAGLPISPIWVVAAMLLVVIMLGTIMESATIIMVSVPLFMPAAVALGFDPIWFGLILLLAIELGMTTPPFGMTLFAFKAVAPAGYSMREIYAAAVPFLVCDLIVLVVMVSFPAVALWLPSTM